MCWVHVSQDPVFARQLVISKVDKFPDFKLDLYDVDSDDAPLDKQDYIGVARFKIRYALMSMLDLFVSAHMFMLSACHVLTHGSSLLQHYCIRPRL